MVEKNYLYSVIDETVVGITKKIADISLSPCAQPRDPIAPNWSATKVEVTGLKDMRFFLYYQANPRLLCAIARRMKGRPVENSEDMGVYIKEYFNIICGRAISRINREKKYAMRFGVPSYYAGGVTTLEKPVLKMFYECPEEGGAVSIIGVVTKIAFEQAEI